MSSAVELANTNCILLVLLNLSVDGSVRVPMKGVPSCDMLRVGAGSQ
jgi:hypothetical protein